MYCNCTLSFAATTNISNNIRLEFNKPITFQLKLIQIDYITICLDEILLYYVIINNLCIVLHYSCIIRVYIIVIYKLSSSVL